MHCVSIYSVASNQTHGIEMVLFNNLIHTHSTFYLYLNSYFGSFKIFTNFLISPLESSHYISIVISYIQFHIKYKHTSKEQISKKNGVTLTTFVRDGALFLQFKKIVV